jgi:hypothetical protein
VSSDADLKDLQMFSHSDEDSFCLKNIIDLQDLNKSAITGTKKYESIIINSNYLNDDILENFNFKSLMPSSATSVLDGLDIIQL